MSVPLAVSSQVADPNKAVAPGKNPTLQSMMYEALLLETKGRAKTTDVLLFDWGTGDKGSGDAPNLAAGVMGKLSPMWAAAVTKPAAMVSDKARP